MKIICKILAFGTIALSVGGCDLTMLPEHELSPEQYFQNESDLTLWSNQFYNDNLESADIGINDADDKIDNGLSDYITGSRNAASQTWSFSALRKINYLLEHLDQCPRPSAGHQIRGCGPVLPRLLLLPQSAHLRRRALLRPRARLDRRRRLQGARRPRLRDGPRAGRFRLRGPKPSGHVGERQHPRDEMGRAGLRQPRSL